jgi:GNAT superfamily N-acetyltransferase
LILVQALLQKIPFQPIQIAHFEVLRLDAVSRHFALRGDRQGFYRIATSADMESLVRCLDKRDTYGKRFQAGDLCIAAIVDGQIIGYEWLCVGSKHVEERYGFQVRIPEDAIYAYDAYVLPEYRRKGVWLRLQGCIVDWLEKCEKKSVIAIVDYGNDLSRKAHTGYGYSPIQAVSYIRVLWSKSFKVKEIRSTVSRNG